MRVVLLLFFWSLLQVAWAQTISEGEVNPRLPEEQMEVQESMPRLNLNDVTREELFSCPLFTEQQVDLFLAWRQRYGPFLSVYELQAIPEFTLEVIQQWQGMAELYVEEKQYANEEIQTTLTYRSGSVWPRSKGYVAKVYPGLPWSSYFRLRHRQGKRFAFGLLWEQDAGEVLRWDMRHHQYGLDHFSAFILLENIHPHCKIILGDFRAGFGKGLVCGARAAFFSAAAGMPMIFQPGLVPNTSAAEYGYCSGAGFMWKKKEYNVDVFLSARAMDAHLYEREGKYEISSFSTSGLHRTRTEQHSRKNVDLTLGAVHAQKKFSSAQLGFILSAFSYSHAIMSSSVYYKPHAFSGRTGGNASVHGEWRSGPARISGELAVDVRGHTALLLQALLAAGKHADLGLLYLSYASGYYAPLASTISRNAQPENEKGWTLYVNILPSVATTLRAQVSIYRIPWLTYGTRVPATGNSCQLIAEHRFSKSALFKIQYRYRSEDQGLAGDSLLLPAVALEQQQYWRGEFQYQLRAGMRVYAIGQHQRYRISSLKESGSVMALGMQQQWKRWKLRLTMVMFHTDSYASRLYVYEQGSGADFRFRALYGSGMQYVVGIKFRISKAAGISLKYSYMHIPGQAKSGSSYDEKTGDRVQEFAVQYNGEF